jgi:Spy/CpxP family protein refolding chaperone
MNRYTIIAGVCVLVAFPAALSPAAVQSSLVLARPSFSPLREALEQLGLTPGQRRQLAQMRRAHRRQQVQLTPQIRARRQELAELYRSYPLDEARAASLIDQIKQLEAQRLRMQLQSQLELRRILRREQFLRFTQIMERNTAASPVSPARPSGP